MCQKELDSSLPVEPSFFGRKLYDSEASHGELGADFFPEGSQRVYVSLLQACQYFLISQMLM